jgi:hypothetical protein
VVGPPTRPEVGGRTRQRCGVLGSGIGGSAPPADGGNGGAPMSVLGAGFRVCGSHIGWHWVCTRVRTIH